MGFPLSHLGVQGPNPACLPCRHLKLNTIPESLAFANYKGDLLVGLEQHLYIIPHTHYLPSYYQMQVGPEGPHLHAGHPKAQGCGPASLHPLLLLLLQLLWAKFLEPLQDVSLPMSPSSFEALVQENDRRLRQELPVEKSE